MKDKLEFSITIFGNLTFVKSSLKEDSLSNDTFDQLKEKSSEFFSRLIIFCNSSLMMLVNNLFS